MNSKLRKLLYVLFGCVILLLVDVVYLFKNIRSPNRESVHAVRQGSNDHGSRWAPNNNGASIRATVALPINRNFNGNDLNRSVHDHLYPKAQHPHPSDTRHNKLTVKSPNNQVDVVRQPASGSNTLTSGVNIPALCTNVNDTPAINPPAVQLPLHPNLTAVAPSRQGNRQNETASRSEYLTNVNCSVGKSRQRMINTYGAKFNASLPVFVDDQFSSIPNIFQYPSPFGFSHSANAIKSLLRHLPEKGLPPNLKSKSCMRCVVVGNGGLLRKSSFGGVIDNFDVVIRMNNAPTKTYEKDVGSKTTIRIVYPESTPDKEKDYDGEDSIFTIISFKPADILWLETMAKGQTLSSIKEFWKKPATKVSKKASEFRLLNAAIVRETAFNIIEFSRNDGKMNANVPTTGSIAIMLGLRLCDEVSVAGFGYRMDEPNSPVHYYGNGKMSEVKKSWTHEINMELKMLLTLKKMGIITDLTGGIR